MSAHVKEMLRDITALTLIGMALANGWPARINAIFPWIEGWRARPGLWGASYLLGLLLVLLLNRRRPFSSTITGWIRRIIGFFASISLIVWVLAPAKIDLNYLLPTSPGMLTTPILGGREVVWSRSTASGNAVSLGQQEIQNEWILMDIAGGVAEQQGEKHSLRAPLWYIMKEIIALAQASRVVAVPLFAWTAWGFLRNRPRIAWLEERSIRLLLYTIPIANLFSLVLCVALGLTDDVALRGRALIALIEWLTLIVFVDWAGRCRS